MRRAGVISAGVLVACTAVGLAWPVARALEVYGHRDDLETARDGAAASVLAVLAAETEAYAVYVNAPRGMFDADQLELFDRDTAKARAAMETAWLEQKRLLS